MKKVFAILFIGLVWASPALATVESLNEVPINGVSESDPIALATFIVGFVGGAILGRVFGRKSNGSGSAGKDKE